ncbi:MAG: hypothetical protein PVG64_07480 [Syntrophobacterales bacterium]|jgi:hypothetical protein
MKVKELQIIAKNLGIVTGKLKKAELIKSIQLAEENFDCFGTAVEYCDQASCLFREDCLK